MIYLLAALKTSAILILVAVVWCAIGKGFDLSFNVIATGLSFCAPLGCYLVNLFIDQAKHPEDYED